MLKAEQNLLLQSTNQQLLSIRQSELDYFIRCFNTYSFQAVLVAGSVSNGFEQVLTQPANIPRVLKAGYWISSAVAMAFSIHCMATTAFVMIYGPGLALRGPLGSMTRAVKGMIAEHNQIFYSYVGTIISFGINMLFCIWSIMYVREAWVCSAAVVIAMYCWYHYCLRVFNKFSQWDPHSVDDDWAKVAMERRIDEDTGELDSSLNASNKMFDDYMRTDGVFYRIGKAVGLKLNKPAPVSSSGKRTVMAGYFSMDQSGVDYAVDTLDMKKIEPVWERYYFVLVGSVMKWYLDKRQYEDNPSNTVKNRPLFVDDFAPTVVNGFDNHFYVLLTDAKVNPLQLSKTSHKSVLLMFDTKDEMETWLHVFVSVSKEPIVG